MTSPCPIPQLDDASFEKAVLESPFPVFLYVGTEDCRDCRAAQRCLATLMERTRSRVRCFCMHAASRPEVAARYRVGPAPTILLFRGGRVIRRIVGCPWEGELEIILRLAVTAPGPPPRNGTR